MDTCPHVSQRPITAEPPWQPSARFTSRELPGRDRPWLLDDGSLTGRLIAMQQGEFGVQRLRQEWQVPLLSERRLLGRPARELALVREVALLLAGQTVVFARSVFPISSLSGSLAHLRRLHNTSLGAILFRHPGMHRSPFELARLPGNSEYLPPGLRQEGEAWGRRSRFEIGGKGLMVSEVFLEAFQPWPSRLPVHRSQRGKVSAAIMPPTQ